MANRSRQYAVANSAPTEDGLTEYDHVHFETYLRLLDASHERAAWTDVARTVLGIDPVLEYDRAKKMYESHLARAHWMTTRGYQKLLLQGRGT
jgi:Uncharacterized conserved protein (DUF2285)